MKKIGLFVGLVMLINVFSACTASIPEELSSQIDEELVNQASDVLKEDLAQMGEDIEAIGESIVETQADEGTDGLWDKIKNFFSKDDEDDEKEISTKTKIVSISADSLDEWLKEVAFVEKSLVPLGNNIIINANGEQEYRGYMIVGKEVLEYKKISMEIPVGQSVGKQPTKTVYINMPAKVQYTLHKHELGNEFTESAIGSFLAGLVNMQIVATQTCDCGYTSQIEWEIPDITSIKENKVTGNEFYIKTETKIPTK